MTRIVSWKVLGIDELLGDKDDKGAWDVVGWVRDLVRCAKVTVVQVQDQLKLVVIKGTELTKALLDLLHQVVVLGRLCVRCSFRVIWVHIKTWGSGWAFTRWLLCCRGVLRSRVIDLSEVRFIWLAKIPRTIGRVDTRVRGGMVEVLAGAVTHVSHGIE